MRLTSTLILVFWTASMGWLTVTKLVPPLRTGSPPSYDDLLPQEAGQLPTVRWSIRLNEQNIGVASNQVIRRDDGQSRVTSTVTIHDLAFDELIHQRFGGFTGTLLRGFRDNNDAAAMSQPLSFHVQNEMSFDHFGELVGFDCVVDVADLPECIILRGTVKDDRLQLVGYVTIPAIQEEPAKRQPVHKSEFDLPPDSLVVDSLSPRPRFQDLRVGQQWTFQTYRPLSPRSPMQEVVAVVESRERITWNGQETTAHHIVYRRPSGSVLNLDRDLGHAWVDLDGSVLRQSMRWGGLTLTFERLPEREPDES